MLTKSKLLRVIHKNIEERVAEANCNDRTMRDVRVSVDRYADDNNLALLQMDINNIVERNKSIVYNDTLHALGLQHVLLENPDA